MWRSFFTSKLKPSLAFAGIFFLMWQMARWPIWNNHLQVDIWVWWERVNFWLEHGTFAGLGGNEILPLTLLYLFVPLWLIPVGWPSYSNYLPAALTLNLLVLIAHAVLVKNYAAKNWPWFSLSLLCLGPILLFRFDALVTLAILAAFISYTKKNFSLSGFCLGLATSLKLFPVIFLPYLVLILFRQKKIRSLVLSIIYFVEALIVPFLAFSLLGGNWQQVAEALNFHNLKLISIESLPGSIITGWSLITQGQPPALLAGYGIWAVAGPAELFNRLWVLPVAGLYFWLWRQKTDMVKFSWVFPFNLMLVFLVFAKNLNPQYVWWFMFLAPFVSLTKVMWLLILLIAFTNQLVYPVFYTQLIEDFYQHNQAYWVYYLLLLRNVAIVALAYLSLKTLVGPKSMAKGKLAAK
jgi:hypothetical protein